MDIVRASQNPIIINEGMKDLLAKVKKPEKEEKEEEKKVLKPIKKLVEKKDKKPSKEEIEDSFDVDKMMNKSRELFDRSSKLLQYFNA